MKKQTFLKGSLILGLSAAAAKVLGAFFKIPLTSLLGGTGMGYFSCAYGLFLPLYAVLVTGLSTAVARPVAECAAKGDYSGARYLRSTARGLFFLTGLAGMLAAFIAAKPFSLYTAESPDAYPAALCIAPAVLFSCLMAVERGYYEGLCNMYPTALSQGLEAAVKLVCGLYFCHKLPMLELPFLSGCSKEGAAAAGAVIGVTASTAAGYLFLAIYSQFQPSIRKVSDKPRKYSRKKAIRSLMAILIPAALGSLVTNLTALIDLGTVMRHFRRLLAEDPAAFYAGTRLSAEIPPEEAAAFVYGSFMGLSVTVFNLVPSLTNMFAKGVLPCTAQAWARGDRRAAADYARQVLLLTAAAAIPSAWGIGALSKGILQFLFAGRDVEIEAAWGGLLGLVPGIFFLCMAFPLFSLLQAVGRADLPVKIMLAGAAVKLAGNLLLLPILYTAGAAASTSLCYGVILVLGWICLRRELKEPLHLGKPLAGLMYAGACCGAAAWAVYGRMTGLSQRPRLLAAVLCGGAVYGAAAFLMHCRRGVPSAVSQKECRGAQTSV